MALFVLEVLAAQPAPDWICTPAQIFATAGQFLGKPQLAEIHAIYRLLFHFGGTSASRFLGSALSKRATTS
jgi:hypothetical protein